eukprot:gene17218-23731_t
MSKASECLSLFDDFTTAERAQPCPTCTFYHVTCLGNNHPRRPTDFQPIITALETQVLAFLNDEQGEPNSSLGLPLACQLFKRFKLALNRDESDMTDEETLFVADTIRALEFAIEEGVESGYNYMEADPKSNVIYVNEYWLTRYLYLLTSNCVEDIEEKNRHSHLLLVKALHEIGHLLTRPFIKYLKPCSKKKNTPVKIGSFKKGNGDAAYGLEEELMGGRMKHVISDATYLPWHIVRLTLERVNGRKHEMFEIRDTFLTQIDKTKLIDYRPIPQQLVSVKSKTSCLKKRKSSAMNFFNDSARRLIFDGHGISKSGRRKV